MVQKSDDQTLDDQTTILAAAAHAAAAAEEEVLTLRQDLERAKELVRAELDEEFEDLRKRREELEEVFASVEVKTLRDQIRQEEETAKRALSKMDDMRRSTSWRLTMPLRVIKRLVTPK